MSPLRVREEDKDRKYFSPEVKLQRGYRCDSGSVTRARRCFSPLFSRTREDREIKPYEDLDNCNMRPLPN